MSLVYNLIILTVCWVFYTVMTSDAERGGPRMAAATSCSREPAP